MLPFAFERSSLTSERFIETQEEHLSTIFLLTLENERLHSTIAAFKSQEREMQIKAEEVKGGKIAKEELELKKIELNNMAISLQECRKELSRQSQEKDQKLALYQKNAKKEINELKVQIQSFKNKYEEQCRRRNDMHLQELQFESMKTTLQEQAKEKIALIEQLNQDLIYAASLKEQSLQELEKNNKELRRENIVLRDDLSRKEQECLNLKDALKDAPKLEELNRWIAKVKEYEEKQVQACGRISQMSQDLCTSKEKYRRLEHEYKQIQRLKIQLQQAVTSNKDNEDSMTIYFDRLTTYQTVIKELEFELQKAESKSKQLQTSYSLKLKKVEGEKEDAVHQWQEISQQMNKQRTLIHAMQAQLDHYSKISQQTVRNSASSADIKTIQSRIMEEGLKNQQNRLSKEEREKYPSYPSRESTSRDIGKVSHISQRVVCQSQRSSHSMDRVQTQQSDILMKDSGCQDCESGVKVTRCGSTDRMPNPYTYSYRQHLKVQQPLRERINSSTIINDEKRYLLDKLNYLKPQEQLKLTDRSLSGLYGKGRQGDRGVPVASMKYPVRENPKSKLSIARGKLSEQKENMNEMILRRYQNLMGRQ